MWEGFLPGIRNVPKPERIAEPRGLYSDVVQWVCIREKNVFFPLNPS